MTQQWKPGDVAMVTYDGDRTSPAIYSVGTGAGNPVWETGTGYLMAHRIESARPLVVLDPENAATVNDLARALNDQLQGFVTPAAIQAALRSLVTPPRPPEPAGRYAVVEDAAGEEWIKDGLEKDGACSGLWWCVDRARRVSSETWRANWDDFTPVRVLSEGVTP